MTDLSQGSLNPVPGTPILNVTTVPQQVPIGNGATLINDSTMDIILSTDSIPNPSNSFFLRANGASLPITVGPLWASVKGGISQLVVIPEVLNVFNPNVQNTPATVFDQLINTSFPYNDLTMPNGILLPFQFIPSNVGHATALNHYPSLWINVFQQGPTQIGNIGVTGIDHTTQLYTPTVTQTLVVALQSNAPTTPVPMCSFRLPFANAPGDLLNICLQSTINSQLGVEVWGANP